jgi:tetratricopeptide (TPR) repeat protein
LTLRNSTLLLLLAALFATSCADTAPPPPVVAPPTGEARYIIDPRVGAAPPANPKTAAAFDAAWRYIFAGDVVNARKRLDAVRALEPNYGPALLADVAIALRAGRADEARAALERVRPQLAAGYTAANVYEAEILLAENQQRRAYELYRDIASHADAPPEARERAAQLRSQVFEQLVREAQSASDTESVRLLREALAIDPTAAAPRIQLVQRLVASGSWDEARRELEPILNSTDVDRPDVQEALAEIDAGRGRYQEAIVRYQRLQRRTPTPRYAQRLETIKEQFAAANMPPQYQRAVESEAITRADFAVLLYWKIASVRFAQNLGTPPIAVDIAEVPGREELIRAIAVGVLQVDPVTRRVGPGTSITAPMLTRLLARVLTLRGAACARETNDAAKMLAACGVADAAFSAGGDVPVSGRTAASLLEKVDAALSR